MYSIHKGVLSYYKSIVRMDDGMRWFILGDQEDGSEGGVFAAIAFGGN
jgi:hypothetical protein